MNILNINFKLIKILILIIKCNDENLFMYLIIYHMHFIIELINISKFFLIVLI